MLLRLPQAGLVELIYKSISFSIPSNNLYSSFTTDKSRGVHAHPLNLFRMPSARDLVRLENDLRPDSYQPFRRSAFRLAMIRAIRSRFPADHSSSRNTVLCDGHKSDEDHTTGDEDAPSPRPPTSHIDVLATNIARSCDTPMRQSIMYCVNLSRRAKHPPTLRVKSKFVHSYCNRCRKRQAECTSSMTPTAAMSRLVEQQDLSRSG